jgi:alkylhydroperoxidase family enzyme
MHGETSRIAAPLSPLFSSAHAGGAEQFWTHSLHLRELAILTIGHCTGAEYEIAHHQSHGRKAGISAEQLKAVPQFETSGLFNEPERAVMALAKESTLKVDVSDETWKRVAAFLSERQLVELVLTIAWYNSGVRIMGALSIELEESYRQQTHAEA